MQEVVRVFSFFLIGSARDGMCTVVSGSFREMSLPALLKQEGLADSLNCFSLFHPLLVCTVFDHLFGIRLGAFEM